MTERPASWRMPTRKQMEAMARAVGRNVPPARGLAPSDDLPPEYWQSLLEDAHAGGGKPLPLQWFGLQLMASTNRPGERLLDRLQPLFRLHLRVVRELRSDVRLGAPSPGIRHAPQGRGAGVEAGIGPIHLRMLREDDVRLAR